MENQSEYKEAPIKTDPLQEESAGLKSTKKIMVVEDEPAIRDLTAIILERGGYDVSRADGPFEAFRLLDGKLTPDLIISDVLMPGMDGFEFCRNVREERSMRTPFLFLTCLGDIQYKIRGLTVGADDYLPKPYDAEELLMKVKTIFRRSEWSLELDPLTELPGSAVIQRELRHRLENRIPMSVLYVDINHFKAYNDTYGFSKGNEAILLLAGIIERVRLEDRRIQFVGHIGGDDFIVAATAGASESLGTEIIRRFEEERDGLYNEEDRERGYIEAKDRKGNAERYSLLTLSVGAIENDISRIVSYGHLSAALAEAKKTAKKEEGSAFFLDRRNYGEAE